jgi:hypothetical protein
VFLPADCGRNQIRGARTMDRKASDSIVTAIGIDIGKNTFHLVGLDERGAIVLRQSTNLVRSGTLEYCSQKMEKPSRQ